MESFHLSRLFGVESPRSSEGSWVIEPSAFQVRLQSVITQLRSALSSARRALKAKFHALHLQKEDYQTESKLRWLEFQQEKAQWQESQQVAAQLFLPETDVMELNVGGALQLATAKATLCKFPGSRLAALVSDPLYHKGRVFVDRDPGPFAEMLHFLRTGKVREGLNFRLREDLERELAYWELPLVSEPVSPRLSDTFDPCWCAPTLVLENGNQTVRKKQISHGIVLASLPLSTEHTCVKFQVETSDRHIKLFLGLVDRKEYSPANLTSLQWRDAPSSYYWNVQGHELVKTDRSGAFTTHGQYGCSCEADTKTVLGIIFDPRLRTVSFTKEGISQGTAFTDVPAGLFPAVDLWFEAGSVSITSPLRTEADTTAESSLSQITK